jgi:hypothetical protein
LFNDAGLVRSGLSDDRSGLSAAHQYEGYVDPTDLASTLRRHLLIESDQPNVYLHVTSQPLTEPVPIGLVIADLADYNGPREDAQVERLLRQL